jgi:glyoxylase-like metal-dependent hydrolase (beta-lactamase superfamily II)
MMTKRSGRRSNRWEKTKMEEINKSYRFNIGHFECLVIRDTISPMELDFLFPNIPAKQLQELFNQYNIQPGETMDVMCLFIRTADHAILIDTGWGVGPQPNVGKLVQNLQLEGIPCGEIDTIILSHAHPDHIGGITDAENRLSFPNARYIMCKKGWGFWTSEPDLTRFEKNIQQEMLASVQKNLIPIKDSLNLVDSDTEIMPGIEFISAPGHSPDHEVLVISSGTEQLLYSCDLFQHPLQMARPDWCTAFDLEPEQAIKTRTQIIHRITAANMLVFACHFPFPGLGHIVPKGDIYLWQPIDINVSSANLELT